MLSKTIFLLTNKTILIINNWLSLLIRKSLKFIGNILLTVSLDYIEQNIKQMQWLFF